MSQADNGGASIMNIGADQPPARVTRYTEVRTKHERRMGASSLISGMGSVAALKQQLNRTGTGTMSSDFSHAARAHTNLRPPSNPISAELQRIERDIVLQESQLNLERARAAALERQAKVASEVKEQKTANAQRAKDLGQVPLLSSNGGKGIPAALPRGIKYEKLALCFRAWFKHPWYEGDVEGFDVRNFLIRYYMSDQSLEIIEDDKKAFLKRTTLKKANGENFEPTDFAVGRLFTLSGRTFMVCDADGATRSYFSDEYPNTPMAPELAVPVAPMRTSFAPGMERAPTYSTEPDWKGQSRAQRQNPGKFLDDDGKVLTFSGVWDDTTRPSGDVRRLKIRFYVADHTMELGEMLNGNSGRDLTSRFKVLRQRLKKPAELGASISNGVNFGSTGGSTQYFEPKDFYIGSMVPIFGRPIMIISCDGFTRNYFANVLGVPQPANMKFQDPNARPVRKATKMAVQQGFSFLEPQDRIAQLETAIREKLEVASNFGTNNDQKRHLQAMFHSFDSDGSGFLSQNEFKEAMQGFSMFGNDVDIIFNKYDINNDHRLSIVELSNMLYNNPAAMKFSMDTSRTARSGLTPSNSNVDLNENSSGGATAAPGSPGRHQLIQSSLNHPNNPNSQMLVVLEQNLRDKAESLSNFSSSDSVKQRKLADMFKKYDTNGNGTLSRLEFRAALMAMHFPVQDSDMMFDSYDMDGNGSLSYTEFTTILLSRKPFRKKRQYLGGNSCIG